MNPNSSIDSQPDVTYDLDLSSIQAPPVPVGLRDVFMHPVIAAVITIALLGLCTWWISWLQVFAGGAHPYLILYLIPVAVGAAFLGVRGGVAASVIVLILTRVFLLNGNKPSFVTLLSAPALSDELDIMTLTMGMLCISAIAGRLRSTLVQLHISNDRLALLNQRLATANSQLIDSEKQRLSFNRDVLLAVTGGKLRLVDEEDIPGSQVDGVEPVIVMEVNEPKDASILRRKINDFTEGKKISADRIADILTCTTETATNAIKHGNGGNAKVWFVEENIFILITDKGQGIAPAHLARATLEKGYSTRISLGMGYHLILETCDMLCLSTSEQGTSVFLQISTNDRLSETDRLLARYAV